MQKNTIIGIGLVVIIVGLALIYFATKLAPAKAPATSMASTTPLSTGSTVDHAQYYDIDAAYPTKTPLPAQSNDAALSLMHSFINDQITQFKKDGNFDNLTAKDIEMIGFSEGRKEKLKIDYTPASSAHTFTYIFNIYEDTLGAHGNTTFKTFTFDTKTGALLKLSDVFKPGTTYLATLSTLSRAKLPAVIGQYADADMIKGGTTPEAQNFENFYFDDTNFLLLFPPYQVAAYAAGPQTLQISVRELSNILKPEYQ